MRGLAVADPNRPTLWYASATWRKAPWERFVFTVPLLLALNTRKTSEIRRSGTTCTCEHIHTSACIHEDPGLCYGIFTPIAVYSSILTCRPLRRAPIYCESV
jgi:hypothetical protein